MFTKILILFLVVISIGNMFFPKRTILKSESKKVIGDTAFSTKLIAIPNNFALHKSFSFIPNAQAATTYENATAYIVVDESTGQILAEKNADTSLSIASLTKIMSAVVALDLAKPTDNITVSQNASTVPPTTIGVVPGQQMTIEELLHGMLMTSANDAAQAVADGINAKYGKPIFVEAMNEKAKFLGLKETHFTNPQGFDDPSHKSSAHDLAILATYALSHYSLIDQIVAKDYIHLPATNLHKQFDLYNWNGLLGVYPGVDGVKIGNTTNAGYTTIVRATRGGHSVLVVLLGTPGVLERDLWASQLLDDVFTHNFGLPPVQITTASLENKYATWQYWN